MSTLIAHEWIESIGGAESVMDSLATCFPESEIFTLWNNRKVGNMNGIAVRESWLARSPLRGHKALTLPLMSSTWRNSYLPRADRVISSSHLFAHHISANRHIRDAAKYSYVHTPARYLWYPDIDQRLGKLSHVNYITSRLKRADIEMAKFTDSFAANSQYVANRIEECWDVDHVTVIHPPVDLKKFQSLRNRIEAGDLENVSESARKIPCEFLLSAGRLVSYKRVDLSIQLAALLRMPIVIAGTGPELKSLQSMAEHLGVDAIFLGKVNEETLTYLFCKTAAYLLPGTEDFGIMAVEALASGARVLANGVGGFGEIIVNRVTGILCETSDLQIWKSGFDSVTRLNARQEEYHLEKFSSESFHKNIKLWAERDYQ